MDEDYSGTDAHAAKIVVTSLLAMGLFFFHFVLEEVYSKRDPSIFEQRLNWAAFRERHGSRTQFKRHLRMSAQSFDKLLSYVYDDLLVDFEMAQRRGGPIIPELCLYCTIRYFAGGSYSDIHYFTGISKSSFYRVVRKTILAINTCEQLQIRFPKDDAEVMLAAENFASISTNGAIKNCVCVVDGFLLKITTPSKKEAKNVRSYFSGHYQCYGVNVQAACDHLCRFVYLGVAGPGVMCDRDAIKEIALNDYIEGLPGLYAAIGDCAYKPTEHMVPIFDAFHAKRKENDNFNFYASQLRIRIEMAFGMMVKKWGILNRAQSIKLRNIKRFVQAIGQLHNYCINERIEEGSVPLTNNARDYELDVHQRALRESAADLECAAMSDEYPGWSLNRERMVKEIQTMGITRPGMSQRTYAV